MSIKRLVELFVFSNVYIPLPVICYTLTTYYLFPEEIINWELIGFISAATLFLYPLHRLLSLKRIDQNSYSRRLTIVAPFRKAILGIVLLSFGFLIFFLFRLKQEVFYMMIPLGVLSIGYSIPFIKYNGKWYRLRDLKGAKVFIIAFVVALITTVVPIIERKDFFNMEFICLFIGRIMFLMAITLPFDIRDIKIDQKEKVYTIPIWLGVKKTKWLVNILLMIFIVLSVFQWIYWKTYSIELLIALVISGSLSIFFIGKGKEFKNGIYNAFLIEGQMMIQLVLILFFCELIPSLA